jgi:SAM-dependent methyltransferase
VRERRFHASLAAEACGMNLVQEAVVMADDALCRCCRSSRLHPLLSLGDTPLADALLAAEELGRPEPRYPLELVFCPDCTLVQILKTVPPQELFCRDYPYFSSFSDALLQHSRANCERLIEAERLDASSLVVEIASNDGYMLRHFAERGIPVLGVDPAEGPAAAARKLGIPTECTFFTRDLAQEWVGQGRRADVVIANNVLAHVPDSNGFVAGIKTLLRETGVATLEFPYVKDLIDHCEFDTIYHEHLCYFSVTAVNTLMERQGLTIHRVEHFPIHGGSLRIYVSHGRQRDPSVAKYLQVEREQGVTDLAYYLDFAARVKQTLGDLQTMLRGLRAQGKRIAAYGAAAKGSTLLNCAAIGTDLVDFVVDRNVHKQGKFMPGVHIPIHAPQRLLTEQPDYALLLAWNFKDEIMKQQEQYRHGGGRFIVPIPRPVIV